MRDFLREYNLLSGKRQLLVAVSGGQDSICLLYILYGLQENLGIKLHIAHLDHQLRGDDSKADAQYVSQIAHQLEIPVTVEQRDVAAYQAEKRISREEAAREVRYNFLAEVAGSIGTDLVAVGHTADDHIETVLMHLIRGTGIKGLQGLLPVNHWQHSGIEITVIRPLLPLNRRETAEYCHLHQLEPRIDISNLSLSPLRNRIRQQLIPLLQSYNPRVADALQRTARIAGDDIAFLEKESQRLWDSIARQQADTVILYKEKLLQLPPALQRQLLRMAIERLLGSLKDIEACHIEEMMVILSRPAGKSLNLPQGLIFTVGYDQYLINSDPAVLSRLPVFEGEFVLEIPGETRFSGWSVTATIMPREQITARDSNFTAYLDYNKTGSEVGVRCRRSGDRFQPLGMSQHKKVGQFMIDARIPRAWRRRVPIVYSRQHILWVVGYRIDDRVKVGQDTRQVLCLEFRQTVAGAG